MGPPVRIGAFTLGEPLARGGMGEVWRGTHTALGVPVAVKVLSAAGLDNPMLLDALRSEIRAVASLDHPHVIGVYDHGLVDDEAQAASGRRLTAGTPWLAMEYAAGGTLPRTAPDWLGLRAVLLALLDALAHAHARGVVHRDIKPANVLFGGARPGLKLTDFGMVYALEQYPDARQIPALSGGTPAYMAPEQIEARFVDQGPWTDLYSVGCLAWAMASGRRPYSARSGAAVMHAHLNSPIPRLVSRFDVPAGFEGWVRWMMAKAPASRFRRAADAAWELACLELGPRRARPAPAPAGEDAQAPTRIVEPPPMHQQTTLFLPSAAPVSGPTPVGVLAGPRAPMPADWRRPHRSPRPAALVGAGLGLYGLRVLPLVDREAERDVLWGLLREVDADPRARVVVLRGAAGCGKSRLAEWLCVRGHEVGACTVLRALHNPIDTPSDGLQGMLTRYLRCTGQPPDVLAARLERLLGCAVDPAPPTVAERHDLVWRVLEQASRERPLVVWCDDVQWGLDAVRFARRVLDQRDARPLPVLLVLTAREDALAARKHADEAVRELLALAGAHARTIGPLPRAYRRALVGEILGLVPELADAVEARTDGNPLFAVQLVGDWVQRGLLEVTGAGFALREGARIEVPADIRDVWTARVDRLIEGHGDAWRIPLELAAVLGQDLATEEWQVACAISGSGAPRGLVAKLLDQRLARTDPEQGLSRWGFVHGMLRESLVGAAARADRLRDHHRTCAQMLRTREGRGIAARRGWHLLEAGELEAALTPLRTGAGEAYVAGDLGEAERLMAAYERALFDAAVPRSDERWGRGWVVQISICRDLGQLAPAKEACTRALAAAREHGWETLELTTLITLAEVLAHSFAFDEAAALCAEGVALAEARAEPGMVGRALHCQGLMARYAGETERATSLMTRAIDCYEQSEDHHRIAISWLTLSNISLDAGELALTEERVARARAHAIAHGYRALVAHADSNSAELARYRGDLEAAETFIRSALDTYRRLGHGFETLARINLGFVLLERGDIEAARAQLEPALLAARKPFHTFCAHVGLWCVDATASDEVWAERLAEVERQAEQGRLDGDFGRLARLAGQRALEGGYPERARQAWTVALWMWEKLGRAEDAAITRRELASL